MHSDYLAGVVEGFYGRPWTQHQRLRLLRQMSDWGLNTYFYAPKDDLKHRAIWRECYSDHELSRIAELIAVCNRNGLTFIYGLSPGLDICFSDVAEQNRLKQRMSQLIGVGGRHFALLFDDLPGEMSEADRQSFESLSEAQCFVANAIFRWLREQFSDSRLLFCPTPYCERMDHWKLGGDDYLDQIGQQLLQPIDCLWTGPEIISQEITADSIKKLASRIGRPPGIWDNLHANDYDLRRLFCGPYCGRPAETLRMVRGVLANPNNEFEINFVPLKTLAACLNDPDSYEPRSAYVTAVSEWIDHYGLVRGRLSVRDLMFLTDCYYLPFEDGEESLRLQQLITDLMTSPPDSWGTQHGEFLQYHRRVMKIFEAITELCDRELFYAWSRRIWEFREELDLLASWLDRRKTGEDTSQGFALEHHLPHTCRGGIASKLQQHTTMDVMGRFHVNTRNVNL